MGEESAENDEKFSVTFNKNIIKLFSIFLHYEAKI